MIAAQNNLVGKISAKQSITGKLNNAVIRVYPELENLTVTPSTEQQIFKSSKYGYDNVIVEAVQSEELNITPNAVEQIEEGIFNKVTVAGDSNLIPENIKEGVEIFGVQGTAELKGEENAIMETSITSKTFAIASYLKKIPLIDTSNTTNMASAFLNGSNLESIPPLDTSKVITMYAMVKNCNQLSEFPQLNTSKLIYANEMFSGCTSLTKIPLLDFGEVKRVDSMFQNCISLTDVGGFKDLGKAYTTKTANYSQYSPVMTTSTNLTHDSLMNIINNLYDLNLTYDVANGGTLYTQRLNIGTANKSKLTEEEIAIATSKGWNIV